MLRRFAVPSLLLLAPFAVQADPWKGTVGAGALITTGNSDSQSLNGKIAIDYTSDPWKNTFTGTAINQGDNDGRTAERYTLGNKLDYNLDKQNYLFGAIEWEHDLFGGYRNQTTETAGYGRHVLTGPIHTLDLEIGAGWRETEEQDTGEKDDDAIARFAGKYTWKLSDTSMFAQGLKVETGKTNTATESVTELKVVIVGNLSTALSYTIRNNTDVPDGTKKTDTFASVSLVYGFGS